MWLETWLQQSCKYTEERRELSTSHKDYQESERVLWDGIRFVVRYREMGKITLNLKASLKRISW